MGSHQERKGTDDSSLEVTMEELKEFLEGDLLNVRADPEFKENLRRKLLEMLRARRKDSDGEDSP